MSSSLHLAECPWNTLELQFARVFCLKEGRRTNAQRAARYRRSTGRCCVPPSVGMLNAVQSMLTGEKPSRVQLASVNHAHASLLFGGTIAFAEVLTQHSKASGSFGWDGKELWVAGGLRATFRQAPHSCQLHVPTVQVRALERERFVLFLERERFVLFLFALVSQHVWSSLWYGSPDATGGLKSGI